MDLSRLADLALPPELCTNVSVEMSIDFSQTHETCTKWLQTHETCTKWLQTHETCTKWRRLSTHYHLIQVYSAES
jgi:hypothetical protein